MAQQTESHNADFDSVDVGQRLFAALHGDEPVEVLEEREVRHLHCERSDRHVIFDLLFQQQSHPEIDEIIVRGDVAECEQRGDVSERARLSPGQVRKSARV